MKYDFHITELDKITAIDFVQERHYSKVMPRLTKHYLGVYNDTELAGVLTLGCGTRPKDTIRQVHPDLDSPDF